MRRQDKYPETKSFIYYNANERNKIGGDCVIRAVATALNQTWEQTVREMTEVGIKYGYVCNDQHIIDKYLKTKGWVKCKQPRHSDNTKYTGSEFCNHLSFYDKDGKAGAVIANIGGHHIVCIKPTWHGDGMNCRYKVHDIWNSTGGCIGNYWTAPNVYIGQTEYC